MKIQCPQCRMILEADVREIGRKAQCPGCGTEFELENPALAPCPDCFELISKRAATCPKCGAPLKAVPAVAVAADSRSAHPPVDISQEKELAHWHPAAMNFFWGILLGIITLPIVIGIFILIAILIAIYCTHYKVTTYRIIIQTGFLSKSQNEIWIRDMRAANLEQGIWQRIVGIGNISIGTAATAGTEIRMYGVKKPKEAVELINSLRQF